MNTELGPAIASFTVVSSSPSTNQDARLWLAPDVMYALGCSPGALKLIGVKDNATGALRRLASVFNVSDDIVAQFSTSDPVIGDYVVPASIWPSPKLKKQAAACSDALYHSLGSPIIGSIIVELYDIGDVEESSQTIDIRIYNELIRSRSKGEDEPDVVSASTPSPSRRHHATKPIVQSPSMRRSSVGAASTPPLQRKDSTSYVSSEKQQKIDVDEHHASVISEAFTHPAGKTLSILQFLAFQALKCRYVLRGNLVRLPLMGSDVILRIENIHSVAVATKIAFQSEIRFLLQDDDDSTFLSGRMVDSYSHKAAIAAGEAIGGGDDGPAALAAYQAATAGERSIGASTFSSLGGLQKQMKVLEQLVIDFDAFAAYNIIPPSGVLLHGPPGTGKTALARAAATAANAALFVINGPDVVSEFLGESEQCLRGVFAAARALAPSIIFMDEIDAIAPSRGDRSNGSTTSSVSARLVTTLLAELDALRGKRVVVLAATNRVDALDDSLRRPGRLDKEIEVGVPSPAERLDILQKLLVSMRHELTREEVALLSDEAHGFVGADLVSLCSEAALITLRRSLKTGTTNQGILKVDFDAAKAFVRPSALREVALEKPTVRWSDVGGNDSLKQQLKEAIEWPLKNKASLERLGAVTPRGVLLYGPPGCSKTLLAKAVACEASMNFLAVKGPELLSKYVGESEKAIRSLFHKARTSSPAIIFFDEIDGLVGSRSSDGHSGGVDVGERVLSQLLQEMDGLQRGGDSLIVLAATNRPDCIDSALLRPGRFDRLLYVPPPDLIARRAIFEVHTREIPLYPDVDLDTLAACSDGYTGADIAGICQQAALFALEENDDASQVKMHHMKSALEIARPSLSSYDAADISMYNLFKRHVE